MGGRYPDRRAQLAAEDKPATRLEMTAPFSRSGGAVVEGDGSLVDVTVGAAGVGAGVTVVENGIDLWRANSERGDWTKQAEH